MGSEFEYDVFLSYSSKDKEKAHALAKRLKQDGLRVWLDAWAIRPGDSIPLKIQQGLEQSRVLLMCMSPDYFSSDWGRIEHLTLLFRDPTNAERRFIPLLIAICQPPDIIAQFARIDCRTITEEAYARILTVCREVVTSKPPAPGKQVDQARMVMKGHAGPVLCLAITPDGQTAVSGSTDKTLKVWDLNTGKCRSTLIGHADSVWGVAVTPDGGTIVSSSEDKTLKVWDLNTGKCCSTLWAMLTVSGV